MVDINENPGTVNLQMLMLLATTHGYGVLILQTIAALALIAAVAWVLTRFLGPKLLGRASNSRMRVVERLPLEPRRSLYLVEVDGRNLLVGVSENNIRLIEELSASNSIDAQTDKGDE